VTFDAYPAKVLAGAVVDAGAQKVLVVFEAGAGESLGEGYSEKSDEVGEELHLESRTRARLAGLAVC